MLQAFFDGLISTFSPRWGHARAAYRHRTAHIQAASQDHAMMRKMISGSKGGYEAGKTDRLKGYTLGSPHENDVPRAQIKLLRYRSWNLYRNNPQARKIVRTLKAKVVGRSFAPQSTATNKDGTPFTEFRKRARQIFDEFSKECDWRGKPGSGGQHFVTLAKTALQANLLSGGALTQFHHLDKKQQRDLGLYVPLQVQLLHIDRLDDTKQGDDIFAGVKVDKQNRPIGFWVTGADGESTYVDSSKMKHLFAEEDIDQILGSPWFGAALLTMDDRQSCQYNETVAIEAGSCIVAGYRRSPGQVGGIGLQGGDNADLADADGNPITRLQPMMFLDLGQSGEIEMIGGTRPNTNLPEFLSYLVRSEAVSMPGVKSSTLTGDYRNSSFSSERSADNDVWPELEELQDWFAVGFCQPIYEECIKAAVLAGLFDKVKGFSVEDFNARQREYLAANWQGPVSRSINPKDDADASAARVKNSNSTPQIEASALGRDIDQILDGIQEFITKCKDRGIPEEYWKAALGIEQPGGPPKPAGAPRPSEQAQDDAFHNRVAKSFSVQNNAA